MEFEILDLKDLFQKNKKIVSAPHRDNFYHILWIQQGTATHSVDFNPIKVTADAVLFIPKDCVHFFDAESDYSGKAILFTDDFFCKNHNDHQFLQGNILYNDIYGITRIQLNPPTCELSDILRDMETEFSQPTDTAQHDILRNLLHNFLLIAGRVKYKQGFKRLNAGTDLDYLILFKDLLEKNFKTEKLVSKYISDLNVTENRLNKATTLILDKTPKQVINERVLLEARRLLAHDHTSIKEIAYELGFNEPTNFIKYFRKHTQNTPSGFRKNAAAIVPKVSLKQLNLPFLLFIIHAALCDHSKLEK